MDKDNGLLHEVSTRHNMEDTVVTIAKHVYTNLCLVSWSSEDKGNKIKDFQSFDNMFLFT